MRPYKEESRLLASLAVFRELYDSQKEVYDIIAEFVREIIIVKAKHNFNITEITQLLNEYFDFSLPEAVVKTSLRKLNFLDKSKGIYNVTDFTDLKGSKIDELEKEMERDNNIIIDGLFDFIEEQTKNKLSDIEKGEIIDSFCFFLLDEMNGEKHFKYISAFIIKNKFNSDFAKQLKIIKEGVILYTGIKYSNQNVPLDSWNSPLRIYIDTEILFYFAGFDGELYKTLFYDFLSLVNEINERKGKKIIELVYFRDTVNEIENFFAKAEQIITGREKLIPTRTAMSHLCDGCKTASDLVQKKISFYHLLKINGIREDDYEDYFLPKNHKYNISDLTIIENISAKLRQGDITENLRSLNFISIRRGDSINNNFENIGNILLSGNKKTHKVAWSKEIKQKGDVPLVTDLYFITSKLWSKLNKGFGIDETPMSFSVITRAQIVLSSQLNDSVRTKYDRLHEQFKNKELSEEEAVAALASLRELSISPEDVDQNNLGDILNTISDDKLEWYIQEKQHLKNKVKEETDKGKVLSNNLHKKEVELEKYKKTKTELSHEVNETKKRLLNEKLNSIDMLEKQKSTLDKEVEKAHCLYKIFLITILLTSYALSYYLIWKYGWNYFEQWTWILSFTVPAIISASYMLIQEKKLNLIDMLRKRKEKVREQVYIKFGFDIEQLDKLITESNELKTEIAD